MQVTHHVCSPLTCTNSVVFDMLRWHLIATCWRKWSLWMPLNHRVLVLRGWTPDWALMSFSHSISELTLVISSLWAGCQPTEDSNELSRLSDSTQARSSREPYTFWRPQELGIHCLTFGFDRVLCKLSFPFMVSRIFDSWRYLQLCSYTWDS